MELPSKAVIIQNARAEIFQEWRDQDPSRSEMTRFPKRIFKKNPSLKSELEEITQKACSEYDQQMSVLYSEWLLKNEDRPYLNAKDRCEAKLARWCSKQIKTKTDILEKHRTLPFNHLKQYSEWCSVKRRYPSVRTENKREKRLAKWAIAVRVKYSKNELPDDEVEKIEEMFGEEWLTNAPFLTQPS